MINPRWVFPAIFMLFIAPAAFSDSTAHFAFILDRRGRVIAQTDSKHFTFGEDVTQLPILQMARATEAPSGNLDYRE